MQIELQYCLEQGAMQCICLRWHMKTLLEDAPVLLIGEQRLGQTKIIKASKEMLLMLQVLDNNCVTLIVKPESLSLSNFKLSKVLIRNEQVFGQL